ncbi:MAG TPA: agmatinase [Armatimonadetes bacterium]|nr:agmatinase [Armatimonadota bacterium]
MRPVPFKFLGAESNYQSAQVVIIGVPLERTLSYRGGTSQAPLAVRVASDSVESYSAIFRVDIARLGLCDLGDLECEGGIDRALAEVEEVVRCSLRDGKRLVLIGGEHTLTLGALRGIRSALGGVQLLALDAHSDFREEYEGQKVCHATTLRRCSEVADRIVVVGARSFYGGEVGEPIFRGVHDFAEALDPGLPLYLSVDLDVLDPSNCPGVTNPEPGGLDYWDIVEVFSLLRGGFKVVALDVCELSPPFDPSGVSAICAAKLIVEGVAALFGREGQTKNP